MAFPYVKTNWIAGVTAWSAALFNHLETQFDDVIALLTTRGDIIYRGAATWERLAKGTLGQVLTQGADDPAWATKGLTVAETEVFSGNSPNAWTDLDLSAVVGTNLALVLLKIYTSVASRPTAVRKNGDADEFWANDVEAAGSAFSYHKSTIHYAYVVATDANGIIEWKMSAVTANTTIDVIAYIV